MPGDVRGFTGLVYVYGVAQRWAGGALRGTRFVYVSLRVGVDVCRVANPRSRSFCAACKAAGVFYPCGVRKHTIANCVEAHNPHSRCPQAEGVKPRPRQMMPPTGGPAPYGTDHPLDHRWRKGGRVNRCGSHHSPRRPVWSGGSCPVMARNSTRLGWFPQHFDNSSRKRDPVVLRVVWLSQARWAVCRAR